jgi:hypothetical protein
MIDVKCTKRDCVHLKNEKEFTLHLKKFFTDLPLASQYDGSYRLSKVFFDNPDGLTKEFGELRLGCNEL